MRYYWGKEWKIAYPNHNVPEEMDLIFSTGYCRLRSMLPNTKNKISKNLVSSRVMNAFISNPGPGIFEKVPYKESTRKKMLNVLLFPTILCSCFQTRESWGGHAGYSDGDLLRLNNNISN